MRRLRLLLFISLLAGLTFALPLTALAQDATPTGPLSISTNYPSMVVGIGETVSLNMQVFSPSAQTVKLETADLPKDWVAEFRGGGRVVESIYVGQNATSTVELRVTPPTTVTAGTYNFTVIAQGGESKSEFPVEFIVKEKIPPELSFQTDYPTLREGSDFPFNFSTTLKNDGDDDVTVSLSADAPQDFSVTFNSAGKDITNLPTDIKAGSSQNISITAKPLTSLAAGDYPINILAQGESVQTSLALTAEVTGQENLAITTSDGRLSGDAYLGRNNPIKLVLRNTGNSPAEGVKLTASSPTGWTVTMDPADVVEVPANGEVDVTANVKPADQAIAGDYMITFNAQPSDSASQSADFRVTVRASTLWGIVGVALIAVAVAIVGLAVVRFGRR